MKMEKSEIDYKWRNLKKKTYSEVRIRLRKNILLQSRNKSNPKITTISQPCFLVSLKNQFKPNLK